MARSERGAYGNKRGKEAQRRRRQTRLADPRVAQALMEAREHQAQLDALVAAESSGAGRPKLRYERVDKRAETIELDPTPTPSEAKSNPIQSLELSWNLRDVYHNLRLGYSIPRVSNLTGYDIELVADCWVNIFCEPEEDEGGEE